MDMHAFLRNRRSIRRFQARTIEESVISRLLESAIQAPSAHNRQPWRFAIVSSGAKRSLLIDALARDFKADLETDGKSPAEVADLLARSRARIEAAPLAIILCMDASSMDKYPDARRIEAERIMAIQSTANAGYALLLAAHAEGLGAAWNCAPLFAPRSVAAALRLPSTWNPQALFLIGYAAGVPRRPNRMSIDEVSLQI